jgi:hypothetical protein
MSTAIDELFAELAAGIPDLPGARCKGRTEWDEWECPETIEFCIHHCNSCVELQKCSQWHDSLTPAQRPTGVCAGRLNKPRRPRKPKDAA